MARRKSILTASTLALIVTGFVGLSALGGVLLASNRFARILPAGEWPRIGVDDGSAEYGISWAGDRLSTDARGQSEAKDRLADVVDYVRPTVVSVTAKYLDRSGAVGSRGVGLLFEGNDPRGEPRTLMTSAEKCRPSGSAAAQPLKMNSEDEGR
jgi:hypothetical protein